MILEAEHRSVIQEVRDMMYDDASVDNANVEVSFYICSNIERVLKKREGVAESDKLSQESQDLSGSLRHWIMRGIFGYHTFGGFLKRAFPDSVWLSDETLHEYAVLGRLAWLDKILATGEILEEKLQKDD